MSSTTIPIFGGPGLEISITDRGVSDPCMFFSAKIVEQLEIKADMTGWPDHVKAQVRERRGQIRDIAYHNIARALNSDRYQLAQLLKARGMNEAASFIMTEKVTK